MEDEPGVSQEGVPPGYEAVSLVEALNGPTMPHRALNLATGGSLAPAARPPPVVTVKAGSQAAAIGEWYYFYFLKFLVF